MAGSDCQNACLSTREREIATEGRLARLEGKVDSINEKLDEAILSQIKDHGKRIASLERARAYSTGWVVGAGAVAGAAASLVGKLF